MPLFLLEKTHVGCFFSTGLLSRCLSICFVLYSPPSCSSLYLLVFSWGRPLFPCASPFISAWPPLSGKKEAVVKALGRDSGFSSLSWPSIWLICFVSYSSAPLLLLFEENTHHAAMGWVLNNPWLVWLKQNEPKTNVCDSLLCFM